MTEKLLVTAFFLVVSFYHFLAGAGIYWRKPFLYVFTKSYISNLRYAFPIGTYLARKLEAYIKENGIDDLALRKRAPGSRP